MTGIDLRPGRALAIVALAAWCRRRRLRAVRTARRVDRSTSPALPAWLPREEDHVTALELAAWIHDRKPGLRIIDVREPAEFAAYQIPAAENVPLARFGRVAGRRRTKRWCSTPSGGAHAAQAWVFLRALGHRQVFFLRGGLGEWIDDVMNPVASTRRYAATSAAWPAPAGSAPPLCIDDGRQSEAPAPEGMLMLAGNDEPRRSSRGCAPRVRPPRRAGLAYLDYTGSALLRRLAAARAPRPAPRERLRQPALRASAPSRRQYGRA